MARVQPRGAGRQEAEAAQGLQDDRGGHPVPVPGGVLDLPGLLQLHLRSDLAQLSRFNRHLSGEEAKSAQPKYKVEGDHLARVRMLNVFESCTLQVRTLCTPKWS